MSHPTQILSFRTDFSASRSTDTDNKV